MHFLFNFIRFGLFKNVQICVLSTLFWDFEPERTQVREDSKFQKAAEKTKFQGFFPYQEAFLTPGINPALAISRNWIRERPNRRI